MDTSRSGLCRPWSLHRPQNILPRLDCQTPENVFHTPEENSQYTKTEGIVESDPNGTHPLRPVRSSTRTDRDRSSPVGVTRLPARAAEKIHGGRESFPRSTTHPAWVTPFPKEPLDFPSLPRGSVGVLEQLTPSGRLWSLRAFWDPSDSLKVGTLV